MKKSEDGKLSLREITNKKRQEDDKKPITEQIDTNIDYLPIDRMVEIIKDKVLSSAKDGSNTAYADFILIHHNGMTERQEYELLNVLYSRLSEVFTDDLELCISWIYDYSMEESFMVIDITW